MAQPWKLLRTDNKSKPLACTSEALSQEAQPPDWREGLRLLRLSPVAPEARVHLVLLQSSSCSQQMLASRPVLTASCLCSSGQPLSTHCKSERPRAGSSCFLHLHLHAVIPPCIYTDLCLGVESRELESKPMKYPTA